MLKNDDEEVIQRDREERIRMAESDQEEEGEEEEEDLYDLMFEEDYDFDYITS